MNVDKRRGVNNPTLLHDTPLPPLASPFLTLRASSPTAPLPLVKRGMNSGWTRPFTYFFCFVPVVFTKKEHSKTWRQNGLADLKYKVLGRTNLTKGTEKVRERKRCKLGPGSLR